MSHSRPWISDGGKTVLIYSPKAACTTLHHWFIKELCEINDKRDPRIIAREKGIIKNYEYIKPDYNIYFFIRDPIKRCISCFINKFIIYTGVRLNKDNLENFSNKLLKNYEISYDTLTFNRYLSAIEYGIGIKNIDVHFNSQVCEKNFNKIREMNPKIYMTSDIKKVLNLDYKLNNSKIPDDTDNYKDITNILVKNIDLKDLKYNNFSSSYDRIRNIYKIDYKFIEKNIN